MGKTTKSELAWICGIVPKATNQRIVEDPERTNALLRLLGAKYFPQGYDIEKDMRDNAPNAYVLELQIEHLSGKRVREK